MNADEEESEGEELKGPSLCGVVVGSAFLFPQGCYEVDAGD